MLGHEDGQAVVEYAVMLVLVSVGAVLAIAAIGVAVDGMLSSVLDGF